MGRAGCIALLIAAIIGVAALLSIAIFWTGGGPLEEQRNVTISDGATLTSAAEALEEEGVIASSSQFPLFAKLLGSNDPIQAGEFEIPARASPADVLDILQHATPVQRFVTIPEGTPSVIVHDRLMAAPYLTGEIPVPAEGSILADTYSYERGEARSAVVARMQAAMQAELARLWEARSENTVVDTPEEAVILASIVEKETAVPSERPLVAGVYSNRLRRGMRLQADPTIIYPITRGRPLGRRIRRSEIQDVNDYNTYAMAGLPAGPIANVGVTALEAVLDPAETDALYFVADGEGGHAFAETLEEHNRNVQRWYELRRRRGEM
ncbi:MAG: endolytic transglycosylase MltG [Sphingomonadales bacterium]|nr:endolytic transglycosylase MltG [Sphingomonadales bacterium]